MQSKMAEPCKRSFILCKKKKRRRKNSLLSLRIPFGSIEWAFCFWVWANLTCNFKCNTLQCYKYYCRTQSKFIFHLHMFYALGKSFNAIDEFLALMKIHISIESCCGVATLVKIARSMLNWCLPLPMRCALHFEQLCCLCWCWCVCAHSGIGPLPSTVFNK